MMGCRCAFQEGRMHESSVGAVRSAGGVGCLVWIASCRCSENCCECHR